MAYEHGNLRKLADDKVNNTRRRSVLRSVNDVQLWTYVTDDAIATVLAAGYFDRANSKLTRDDLIYIDCDGGWGFLRVESSDRTARTVTTSQQLTGVGGGGGGAVTSVVGQIGAVNAGQIITAIDAVANTNLLTDAERANIVAAAADVATQANIQTLLGVPAGTLVLPATTGTVLAAANLVTRMQDIATALGSAGGGSVNTVAGVAPVAGDVQLAALLAALQQDDIQTLLGVAAGTGILPQIPAGTGTALNAGNLVAQLAELKNRIDAGGGGIGGDLTALEALASTGFAVRTGTDVWAQRTLVQPANGFTITNANGVAGNPTFTLTNDLAALEALAANGLAERTGADAWAIRAIGLAINNIVERTARGGIEYGDNAANPNGQRWFSDEADDQSLQYRYGTNQATATRRASWPPGAGAAGTVLTSLGAGVTAWQAVAAALNMSVNGGANINTAAVSSIDIDGTRATLTENAAGQMNLAVADSLVMRGDYDATANSPDLTQAAQQIQGDAYRVSVAGNQDIGNGAESFAVGDIVYRHTDGTWQSMRFSNPQTAPTHALPSTLVNGGTTTTVDSIPFAGAVSGDGFVIGVPTDIANNLIDIHPYYQADGLVRLEITNNGPANFNIPAQTLTIYKINGNAPMNVPGTITGLSNAAGLAPVAGGAPGTSSTVARSDHQHAPQPPSTDPNNMIQAGADQFSRLTAADAASIDAGSQVEVGSDNRLAVFDLKRIALTGTGAVALALATHRNRLVELTDNTTTSINVATFAVAKADGQAIDRAAVWNGTGADITVTGGAGATTIPDQGIALVQSVNGTALVTVLSGGTDLAVGADGSVIVQVGNVDTRVQELGAASVVLATGVDARAMQIPAPFAGEILSAEASVGANSFDYTAAINGTNVTGLAGVTVNTTAVADTAAAGANTFAIGDLLSFTLANATTATDLYLALNVRRTGA